MVRPVQCLSVATAAPDHVLDQRDVASAARDLFSGRYRSFDRLSRVFETAGIVTRRSVRPLEWFAVPHGWADRAAAYLDGAAPLFVRAAANAIAQAGLGPEDIDAVVTVSSTGVATPSLEARAAGALGLRTDVQRAPLFGLGCAGGVQGLSVAAGLAAGRPGSRVLLVAVELCTLAFRMDRLTNADIVAAALFGDGAAACVLSTEGRGRASIEGSGDHLWPDTIDIMGWDVDSEGLGVVFAQAIPAFAQTRLRPAVTSMLAASGVTIADVDRFVCHPGGVKVIQALETALDLDPDTLDHERAVLAEFGNMSSPTVLFVLERALAEKAGPRRLALTAMGPGFSAACAILRTTP